MLSGARRWCRLLDLDRALVALVALRPCEQVNQGHQALDHDRVADALDAFSDPQRRLHVGDAAGWNGHVVAEERPGVDAEDCRDAVQGTGGDAVLARLVFLHLLEADAEGCGECCLTYAHRYSGSADPGSDSSIKL